MEGDMSVPDITEGKSLPIINDNRRKTDPADFSKVLNNAISQPDNPGPQNTNQPALIEIGRISKETPTVSHILINHPDYADKCWDIVFSSVNRGKEFTKMQEGTIVALKPGSNEVVWGKIANIAEEKRTPVKSDLLTEKIITPKQNTNDEEARQGSLADAVKLYIGASYDAIDCYGLIVRGLKNLGIKYSGRGGLREKLEALAASKGLPANAYFNGEGLVEKAGIKVYSRAIRDISNAKAKAEEIYADMAPYLREGLILSFSTPTRGHTGVVSRHGDDWTYINSGVIDHEISAGRISKRVGEEFLKAEINNWCALAAGRNEPLILTIGHVDGNKLPNSNRPKITS